MKILTISDLHGRLPEVVPKCDLLLIAGDIFCDGNVYHQAHWVNTQLKPWLDNLECKVIACAGNHDWLMYEDACKHIPGSELTRTFGSINWIYLQDQGVTYPETNGLRIWGTPWQKPFCGWAFNIPEDELEQKWNLIPDDTDILICHSPPHGYGDYCSGEHQGSPSLTKRIEDISPALVVYGHIHQGRGIYNIGNTILANTACGFMEFELDAKV